jgi:hypothetical protein
VGHGEKYPKHIYSTGGRPIAGPASSLPPSRPPTPPITNSPPTRFENSPCNGSTGASAATTPTKGENVGCYFYGTKGIFHMGWQKGWTFYPSDAKDPIVSEAAETESTRLPRTSASSGPISWPPSAPVRNPISDIAEVHLATNMALLGMLSLKLGRASAGTAKKKSSQRPRRRQPAPPPPLPQRLGYPFSSTVSSTSSSSPRTSTPTAPRRRPCARRPSSIRKDLVVYTFGVAKTTLDKEENRKLFEFARLMGIKMIVVEPRDMKEWDNLEALVKEYDIKLAIHNHNLNTVYGDPATVKKVLAARDARIGVCLDVGWITAAGFDAAEVLRGYNGRVFDMHFKDKTTEVVDGKVVPVDTEIGKGKANYVGLFAEIKKSKWSGVLAIETDSKAFASDPNRLVAEAKAYFAQMTK